MVISTTIIKRLMHHTISTLFRTPTHVQVCVCAQTIKHIEKQTNSDLKTYFQKQGGKLLVVVISTTSPKKWSAKNTMEKKRQL